MSQITIIHKPTGTLIAQGPKGWGITPFEGNFYIRKKYLRDGKFKASFIPGLCVYKFLYTWMDFIEPKGAKSKALAWMYFLPNPLFPFIWYRVGIPAQHPEIEVQENR